MNRAVMIKKLCLDQADAILNTCLDIITQYGKDCIEADHKDKIIFISIAFSAIVFLVSAIISANYMIDIVESYSMRLMFGMIISGISVFSSFGLSYGLLYKFWKPKYYTTLAEN